MADILDEDEIEEKYEKEGGKTLAVICGIAYTLAGIAGLGSFLSSLSTYNILFSDRINGAQFGKSMYFLIIFQYILQGSMIVGIIFSNIAFIKYNYHQKWIWKIMLAGNILATLAAALMPNCFLIILLIVSLGHLLTKKQFYLDNNVPESPNSPLIL